MLSQIRNLSFTRQFGKFILMVLLVLLLPSCVSGLFLTSTSAHSANSMAAVTPVPTPTPLPLLPPTSGSTFNDVVLIDVLGLDFAEKRVIDVHRRVSPSVVNITTQVLRRSFFFEIIPEEGAGSGFVIDTEGHILTNYHVIEYARQIEVTFFDETTLPARLIGADPGNDLAVLRVEAPIELLVPVEFGTSANLQVGQRAIVIGNPFGQ
jgi:S1-C subfamily serine protease